METKQLYVKIYCGGKGRVLCFIQSYHVIAVNFSVPVDILEFHIARPEGRGYARIVKCISGNVLSIFKDPIILVGQESSSSAHTSGRTEGMARRLLPFGKYGISVPVEALVLGIAALHADGIFELTSRPVISQHEFIPFILCPGNIFRRQDRSDAARSRRQARWLPE